jgi:hypothetical protein
MIKCNIVLSYLCFFLFGDFGSLFGDKEVSSFFGNKEVGWFFGETEENK